MYGGIMANLYGLFFGVVTSASLMAAFNEPTNTNPSYNQGTNNPTNTYYNQGTNTPTNTWTNSPTNPTTTPGNAPDYRVNVQRDVPAQPNANTYAAKPATANPDTLLLSQAQDRIKGAYKQYNINVNVQNGIATLTGFVNSQLDKDAIERDVRNVPGITKVVNQLTIQK